MSKKEEKTYTPEEAARAVLAKAHEMLSKSSLAKANTAHEIEAGEEPNNDDAEAPEYLANADIEESGQKKKKKQHSEDQDEMDHDDEMEDREIAEDEAEEEVEEHEDEYHKSEHPAIKEYNRKRDAEAEAKLRTPEGEKKRKEENAKRNKFIKKEGKSVEQAAKEVMGDKDLDEVLDQMPSHKRDDVLRKLRQMKKQGMSKGKMMATCKSELAKCGAMERGKKMNKSEASGKDGIIKVYEFLAKSYYKKSKPTRMATTEEKQSLKSAKEKKAKKEQLKKMAAGMAPKAPKEMAKPMTNGTNMPSGKEGY